MITLISFILATIFIFFMLIGVGFFGFVCFCIFLDIKYHYERHHALNGLDSEQI